MINLSGLNIKYDIKENIFFFPKERLNESERREFETYCSKNNIHKAKQVFIGKEGVYSLKENDLTIDLNDFADIKGNAWDPEIINKIKKTLNGKKAQEIIFERIDIFPLNFDNYIINLLAKKEKFYVLDYDNDAKLKFYENNLRYRTPKKIWYETIDINFYPSLSAEKINLGDIQYKQNNETTFIKNLNNEKKEVLDLEDIIERQGKESENTILQAYYDILAPGGKIIFMSSSSSCYRHGNVVFKYKDKLYSPFKNLDDSNLKDLFKDIFEHAGFENIKFSKDKYYKEDVLYITAYKPK